MKPKLLIHLMLQALVMYNYEVHLISANPSYCVDHGYTPKNGYRNPTALQGYSYFPGSVIRYYCIEYFELQPNVPKQQCQLNGSDYTWTPENLPQCVELPVCLKPSISHATFDKELYHKGDIIQISCDDGYTLANKNVSVCLENGEWSSLPFCQENYCPVLQPIENGFCSFYPQPSIADSVPPRTLVYYTCEEGYELEPMELQRRECKEGHWSGTEPECIQEGCDPPDLSLGDYIPKSDHYEVYNTITYLCFPDDDVTRSCQEDHTWSGTPCPKGLTTELMPTTPSHNAYCTAPLPISHGSVLCCSGREVTNGNSSGDPKYCCPEHEFVEFVCDPGYSLKGEANHWICGSSGEWLVMDLSHPGPPNGPPTCYSNTTRPNPGPMSDGMLKPVIGTACGVLVLLSAAIIIAFCRPKLQDIKRRWRELREDEDELIIDGQRILLPSYEEAVTSQDPYLQVIQHHRDVLSSSSNRQDDVPGPSHSYRTPQNDNFRVQNLDRENPRPSVSSDEEMLIPDSLSVQANNGHGQNEDANAKPSQPLVLKAATSVDACVLINQSPIANHQADGSNTKNNFYPAFEATVRQEGFVKDDLFGEIVESNNDPECNLESIYPKTLNVTPNHLQIRPSLPEEGNDILTYPLNATENGDTSSREVFTIHIGDGIIESGERNGSCENLPQEAEKVENSESDETQAVMQNSDHVHIVMSSQTPNRQQPYDEMGSTAV